MASLSRDDTETGSTRDRTMAAALSMDDYRDRFHQGQDNGCCPPLLG